MPLATGAQQVPQEQRAPQEIMEFERNNGYLQEPQAIKEVKVYRAPQVQQDWLAPQEQQVPQEIMEPQEQRAIKESKGIGDQRVLAIEESRIVQGPTGATGDQGIKEFKVFGAQQGLQVIKESRNPRNLKVFKDYYERHW